MIKRRMREKGLLEEEVEEVVVEEPALNVFGMFCEAAERAGVLYILQKEIPDLKEFFEKDVQEKLVLGGVKTMLVNTKISEVLSGVKVKQLVAEVVRGGKAVIEEAKLMCAGDTEKQVKGTVMALIQMCDCVCGCG